jgi:threonine aldolase
VSDPEVSARHAFFDDYSEGCHPDILAALGVANEAQQPAYGADSDSGQARQLILDACDAPSADVHLVPTGTVANTICIAAALRPHEAVIAVTTGHIAGREAGAIEATGHKIILVPSEDGKLSPPGIQAALAANSHYPHMARPRMVYLSNASELGTVYRRDELAAIADWCRQNNLYLLLDGARLGVALAASDADLTLADVAQMTDLFWIGGTKAGALFGEAIVVINPALKEDIAFQIKQRGAMLAKGRVLGAQFTALFRDDLFMTLARHANDMAQRLSTGVTGAGYKLAAPTDSNQVFPILPDAVVDALRQNFDFHTWQQRENGQTVVRLVTSWATPPDQVDRLVAALG